MARKRYSNEDILRLLREIELSVASGSDVAKACRAAGVSDATYSAWRKGFGGMGRSEMANGRRSVCTKRREIAPSHRSQANDCREIALFKFMTANQAEYSVQLMSRTLGVSRSGFYAFHSRPPSARQVADDALTDRITTIHEALKETYGAPRIHAELAEDGIQVGRKRIERLMKAKGLRGVSCRKFAVTTERDPRARPASDLVDRNFYADAPNVLWGADITYVPTWAGFLYLAVVLDAFSRRIIGWAMKGWNL